MCIKWVAWCLKRFFSFKHKSIERLLIRFYLYAFRLCVGRFVRPVSPLVSLHTISPNNPLEAYDHCHSRIMLLFECVPEACRNQPGRSMIDYFQCFTILAASQLWSKCLHIIVRMLLFDSMGIAYLSGWYFKTIVLLHRFELNHFIRFLLMSVVILLQSLHL